MNLTLQSCLETDRDFARALFADSTAALLAAIGSPLREATLQTQWDARESDYLRRDGAIDRLIVVDGAPVGRVIVARGQAVDTLVEIAIQASARGQGIGSAVLEILKRESTQAGHPLVLRVQHGNKAAGLYSRAGFVISSASATELEMRFAVATKQARSAGPIPAGFLPTCLTGEGLAASILFEDLGPSLLDAPFFASAALRAGNELSSPARAPLERTLEELIDMQAPSDAIPLSGIIFHVSRCGSSLLVRSAQADPHTVCVAEVDPIDAVISRLELDRVTRVAALRAIVKAYARRRDDGTRRLVLKLDAWHLVRAELLIEAFPDVPKLVLLREPAAVIASHRARRGSHFVPGTAPALELAIDPSTYAGHDLDAYGCRVLERLYASARALLGRSEVRFLDHAAMDRAALVAAAGFIGCDVDTEAEAEIERRRHGHAKERGLPFDAQGDAARALSLPESTRAQIDAGPRRAYDLLMRGIATDELAIAS